MISGRTAGAAATLLLVLGSYWGMYQHGRSVERAGWEVRWVERNAADSAARVQAEASAGEEEQRRAAAQQKAREDAQKDQKAADADATAADAAGQRLRDEAGKFAVATSCTASDPATFARGSSATRAAMVLSDLLSRAGVRAILDYPIRIMKVMVDTDTCLPKPIHAVVIFFVASIDFEDNFEKAFQLSSSK